MLASRSMLPLAVADLHYYGDAIVKTDVIAPRHGVGTVRPVPIQELRERASRLSVLPSYSGTTPTCRRDPSPTLIATDRQIELFFMWLKLPVAIGDQTASAYQVLLRYFRECGQVPEMDWHIRLCHGRNTQEAGETFRRAPEILQILSFARHVGGPLDHPLTNMLPSSNHLAEPTS